MDIPVSLEVHGVKKCKINKFHGHSWCPKIKSKISVLGILYLKMKARYINEKYFEPIFENLN